MKNKVLDEDYTLTWSIEVFDDNVIKTLAKWQLVLVALSIAFGIIVFDFDKASLSSMLLGALFTLIVFPLHELIHGIFMYCYTKTRVSFGFKKGMLYASTPDVYYTKREFTAVVLAPTVIINLLLILGIATYIGVVKWGFFIAFVCHVSGCTGDLYYFSQMKSTPRDTVFQDTLSGMAAYNKH